METVAFRGGWEKPLLFGLHLKFSHLLKERLVGACGVGCIFRKCYRSVMTYGKSLIIIVLVVLNYFWSDVATKIETITFNTLIFLKFRLMDRQTLFRR